VPGQSAPGQPVPGEPVPGWAAAADQSSPFTFGGQVSDVPDGPATGPMHVIGAGQSGWSSGEWSSPSLLRPQDDQLASQDWSAEPVRPSTAQDGQRTVADVGWPPQPPAAPPEPGWPARPPVAPAPPVAAAWTREQTTDVRPAHAVLGAPVAELRPVSGTFRTQSAQFGSAADEVIVPPAVSLREENRLPIFEAVESDWFRRGRPSMDWRNSGDSVGAKGARPTWASPADEGWRAAEAAAAPTSGGTTLAGLPRRVPQANLIPGTAAETPTIPAPIRSPAATRERFASLQRGMREGKAASGIDTGNGTDDAPGDE
jgi:hypothetical protein